MTIINALVGLTFNHQSRLNVSRQQSELLRVKIDLGKMPSSNLPL
ncbi:hypothetical protein VB620_16180 [Nodularia harveyana UHCC-0300]|uniref:Uncharacterized protein n=1 Tax=Nodularia harveyana UHCC-0300 TaxID=2974287 RepID=A0ABU5UHB3_9CYAN|nr:hypothetical protein [Nodularia harveyana]MEA5582874.1 hypothetical protein [Nodularia harveyana UHCC-0300]